MTTSTRNTLSDSEKKSSPSLSSPIVSKKEPPIGIQKRPLNLDHSNYSDQGSYPLAAAVSFTTPDRSNFVNNIKQTDPRSVRSGTPYTNSLTASPIRSRDSSKAATQEPNESRDQHKTEKKMIRVTPPERYSRQMHETRPQMHISNEDSFNKHMNLDTVKSTPHTGMKQVTPIKDHNQFEREPVSASVSKAVAQTHLEDLSKSSNEKGRGTVSRRGGRTGSMSPSKFASNSEDSTPALLKESELKDYGKESGDSSDFSHKKPTIPAPPRTLSLKPRKYSVSSMHENDANTCSRMQHPNLSSNDIRDAPFGENVDKAKPISTSNSNQDQKLSSAPNNIRPINTRSSCPTSPLPRNTGSGSRHIKTEDLMKDRNVTFSPVPPQTSYFSDKGGGRTPVRSPPPSQQFSDFSGFDARLGSPGFVLSPFFTASPYTSQMTQKDTSSLRPNNCQSDSDIGIKKSENFNKDKSSERDRSGGVTPTNFVNDFGRGDLQSSSFDTGNVLSWLQSPTANSLFSPGGLMSHTNTPRGMYGSLLRTPRTPVMNSGVYLSDSDLPQHIHLTSPKPEVNPFSNKQKGGLASSHLICISPLASSKKTPTKSSHHASSQSDSIQKRDQGPNTPMNLKDVFASPKVSSQETDKNLNGISHKNDSEKYSLDVHMAQRDVYADEDLTVLLQLAETTPHGKGGKKPLSSDHAKRNEMKSVHGPPSSLQLPIIGTSTNGSSSPSKLSRKTAFRDHSSRNSDDFVPPQLALRSNSTGSKNHNSHDMRQNIPSVFDTPRGSKRKNKKSSTPRSEINKNEIPAYDQHHKQPIFSRPQSGGRPPAPSPPSGSPYGMRSHYGQQPPSVSGAGSFNSVPGRPPPPRLHHPPNSGYPHSSHVPPPPPHQLPNHQPYRYQYSGSQSSHPPYPPIYSNPPATSHPKNTPSKKSQKPEKSTKAGNKRGSGTQQTNANKKSKKSGSSTKGRRNSKSTGGNAAHLTNPADREKSAAAISAINKANGSKNDKAAALAAAILRGVTMRPSGKWQAQLYYAGKSRYIGVFDTREKAALAYEIAREKLKSDRINNPDQSSASTEAAVNAARRAAFEGVNEKDPRLVK